MKYNAYETFKPELSEFNDRPTKHLLDLSATVNLTTILLQHMMVSVGWGLPCPWTGSQILKRSIQREYILHNQLKKLEAAKAA